MKKLISIKQLSENISIKAGTLYAWTHMKQIPHYKLGKRVMFNPDEIDKWLEKKKQKIFSYRNIV